jgi:hypothetical protein
MLGLIVCERRLTVLRSLRPMTALTDLARQVGLASTTFNSTPPRRR